jgi:hypothetical protein
VPLENPYSGFALRFHAGDVDKYMWISPGNRVDCTNYRGLFVKVNRGPRMMRKATGLAQQQGSKTTESEQHNFPNMPHDLRQSIGHLVS